MAEEPCELAGSEHVVHGYEERLCCKTPPQPACQLTLRHPSALLPAAARLGDALENEELLRWSPSCEARSAVPAAPTSDTAMLAQVWHVLFLVPVCIWGIRVWRCGAGHRPAMGWPAARQPALPGKSLPCVAGLAASAATALNVTMLPSFAPHAASCAVCCGWPCRCKLWACWVTPPRWSSGPRSTCAKVGAALCQHLPVLLLATTRLQPACPPAQATAGSASTGWSMRSQLDPPMRHKQPRQPCSVWLTVHCRRAAPCG